MKLQRFSWGFANIGLVLAIVVGGWLVVTNRQSIIDWWRLQNYTPSAEISRIADDTRMTQHGRDLFYMSEPQILDRDNFNLQCSTTPEKGMVLGCYTAQRIFLFDVTDERLNGVKEVTAAHEMLHAAYERLPGNTLEQVNKLLQDHAQTLKQDERLQNLLKIYAETQPGEELNELHSILGTEYATLSAELEEYYKRYFIDRSAVVSYYHAYNAEFEASRQRVEAYQRQLEDLKAAIDGNSAQLSAQNAALQTESAQLDSLRNSDTSAYNQRVPGYNARVQAYNDLAEYTQQLVLQHNNLVEQINAEAASQTDLMQSLDSQHRPVMEEQ